MVATEFENHPISSLIDFLSYRDDGNFHFFLYLFILLKKFLSLFYLFTYF